MCGIFLLILDFLRHKVYNYINLNLGSYICNMQYGQRSCCQSTV